MTNTQRVNIGKQHAGAYKALIALSSEVEENAEAAGIEPLLIDLLKIRVSQINGCAFCLRMHTQDALKKARTPTGSLCCLDGRRPAPFPRPNAPLSA